MCKKMWGLKRKKLENFGNINTYIVFVELVEKRKISYFGLALNLFQHLISPNQDDLSYSARTFISG